MPFAVITPTEFSGEATCPSCFANFADKVVILAPVSTRKNPLEPSIVIATKS